MPDGKTHDKITLIALPIIAVVTWFIMKDIPQSIIITTAYLFASFMFNGDLDTVSKPYNRWFIFKIFWVPYQLIFTHRSVFTHGIIIGTVVRIIYLTIIPFAYFYFVRDINLLPYLFTDEGICVLFGLELGNSLHTLSDKTF